MGTTTLPITLRYADTDAQGVVYFGTYLALMDEAATAHLTALGLSYSDLLELGIDTVYAHAEVSYKESIRYGDAIVARCAITRVGNTSYTTQCDLMRGDVVVATGRLVHVCIDGSRAPHPVPDAIRSRAALDSTPC